MSARCVLILCLALYACKEPKEASQSRVGEGGDATVADAGGGNDASASGSTGQSSSGDAIEPIPDDRAPDRVDADQRLESSVRKQLIDCGLINNPDLPVGLERIRDEHGRCFGRCFLWQRAPCLESWEALCGTGEAAMLSACLDSCDTAPKDGFLCEGGNRIPHIFVCDQTADCPSGDDEGARCPSHTCANGDVLKSVGDIVCDAQQDCSDGSDEKGCGYDCETEPKPECTVTGAIRCDGSVDCTDGSDEKNCQDVVCDGGFNVVDAALVCDGDKDCFDGADEKNCP